MTETKRLEDLLRRIPGVTIDREGRITVQGKPITRVLIEGDDLVDRYYQLLTRNLPAETIGKVEILKNYDPNPVLKPLRKTGDIALNIGLKEGVKRTGFTKAEAGGDPGGTYALGLQTVRIRKLAKHFGFGSLAEPGQSLIHQATDPTEAEFDSGSSHFGAGEAVSDFVSERMLPGSASEHRQLVHRMGSVSENLIFRPSKYLQLRSNFLWSRIRAVREQRLLERFQADALSYRNLESTRDLQSRRLVTASVKGTFTPTPGFRMVWQTRMRQAGILAGGQMELNDIMRSQDAQESSFLLDNYLNSSWKPDSTSAWSLELRRISDRKPALLRTDHFLFGPEFPEFPQADHTVQSVERGMEFTGGELFYLNRNGPLSWLARLGLFCRQTSLSSHLNLQNDLVQYVPGPPMRNEARNRFAALYLEPGLEWSTDRVTLRLTLKAAVNQNRFEEPEKDEKSNREALEPNFLLRWQANRLSLWVFNYQRNLRQTGLDDHSSGYLLRGYRDLTRGSGGHYQMRRHRATAGYTYGNWGEKFLVHAWVLGQWDPDYLGQNRMQNPVYSLSEKALFKDRHLLSGNLSLDRFLEGLSLNLKLRLTASTQTYQDRLNGLGRHIRTEAFQVAPEIRSVLEGPFQFHLGVAWDWNRNFLSSGDTMLFAKSFLDLEWDAGNAGFITLHSDGYQTRNAGRPTLLSDLNWQFRNDQRGLGVTLSASNLWNVRSLRQRYLTGTGFIEVQERLRPRAIMLQLSYRL